MAQPATTLATSGSACAFVKPNDTHQNHESTEDRRLELESVGGETTNKNGDGLKGTEWHTEQSRAEDSQLEHGRPQVIRPTYICAVSVWNKRSLMRKPAHEFVKAKVSDQGRAKDVRDRSTNVGEHGNAEPDV